MKRMNRIESRVIIDPEVLIEFPQCLEELHKNYPSQVLTFFNSSITFLKQKAEKDISIKKILNKIYLLQEEMYFLYINNENSFFRNIEKMAENWNEWDRVITNDPATIALCKNNDISCNKLLLRDLSFEMHYLNDEEHSGEIDNLYSNTTPIYYHINDYVFIEKQIYKIASDFKMKPIFEQFLESDFTGKIKPMNREQVALFEALNNKEISIVYAGGTWGSGKTFCMLSYALQELERGRINKIVFVPNNSVNDNSREIGTLPGDLFEKEGMFLGVLKDLIGQVNLEKMYFEQGTLEILPIGYARGRNIENSIIFVNEAQNLTDEHIKLLIGRCGKGTKILFDGDLRQADQEIFKNRSGLRLLLRLKESPDFAKIFAAVKLQEVERSFTAQAADFLDKLI